ncbi:sugar ABC transporter substrate-binding protein [Nocardioides humi]|uniref:Periplasmic binding protein domain-containing protein n=1 Tax=Nocardioides humi TaxID=449461 RepID=A0ABN1ZRT1_9ACTN|nr:sugar ABC transporter substrate-binding protein [Nocardioides humi]
MSTTAPRDLSRRTLLAWGGGIGAAVLASACSAPASTKSSGDKVAKSSTDVDTVAWDYPFTFLPVYAGVAKFAKARAKEKGVALEQTNDNGRPDVQASNLDTLIAKKVPAIVSFPMVFEALEAQAAKALSAGIIWVTYGGTLQNQSASITFSFEEGGRKLGEDAAAWAQESLGGKGKVAFLVDDTIQLGRERTAGMIDAFTKAAPGMEVVGREQAIDPDTALTKTKAILAKHPDVNVVLGITDGAAFGGYKALVEAGRAEDDAETYVGGQDGDLGSLELIRKGTFYRASAALQLRDIGNAVIDVPLAVADGRSDAEASADVPIALVKPGDALLDEIIAQYG